MLQHLSFGWSVRVCGFIILGLMVPASSIIRPRLPARRTRFFLFDSFKDRQYQALLCAIFCHFVATFTPVFYLPTFAEQHGMSPQMSNYLIAILNAASWPGRFFPGIIGGKFGTLNTLLATTIATAITIFCWQAVHSHADIIVFAAVYGFLSGGIITGGMVAFASVPSDPRNVGTYLSMAFGIGGVATLISPPINGPLFTSHNGIVKVSVLNGVFLSAGAAFVLLAKLARGHRLLAKA